MVFGVLTEYSCTSTGTFPVGSGICFTTPPSSIWPMFGCITVFFNCMNSPSTRFAIAVDISSTTSLFRSRPSETDALPSKKSPARMAILLLNATFPESLPRRESEKSITSSCSNDAVWIISVISANRLCFGRMPFCASFALYCSLSIIGLDNGFRMMLGLIPWSTRSGLIESSGFWPANENAFGVPLNSSCSLTSYGSIAMRVLSDSGILASALDSSSTISGRTFLPSASK
ncbi:hypothetical protein OGATHE_006159 [Ogataea polymorpha]|uniref:Uncharacterized protein n=1 Tax=Ogataea polymorpha TaxID=460523 RepID=A0A9P8NTJ3_9ASCO|nr:hypothetical protein OGATHE_006159 [Ogataea polymorpha]